MQVEQIGKYIKVDEQIAPRNEVVVEILDYGDNFFDVHFNHLPSDSLFGNSAFCGIPGRNKAIQMAEELAKKGGVKIRTIKITPEEWM
ncbi:hypothetical protein [Effusibacillus consociatus]|uniref:Uncharacterized protein n=1 Tax=Effusibacillus consociatus TaxID=1117041 RepID=A0ABV9PZW5_9BACL